MPILVVPVVLIIGYGLVRVASSATTEIRDMIFAKVQERALRLISVSVLKHLHDLSLRFHLERQRAACRAPSNAGPESIDIPAHLCSSASRRSFSNSCS